MQIFFLDFIVEFCTIHAKLVRLNVSELISLSNYLNIKHDDVDTTNHILFYNFDSVHYTTTTAGG